MTGPVSVPERLAKIIKDLEELRCEDYDDHVILCLVVEQLTDIQAQLDVEGGG